MSFVACTLVTGTLSPVNIDSFKTHSPLTSKASHGIILKEGSISKISPGTKSTESICFQNPFLHTLTSHSNFEISCNLFIVDLVSINELTMDTIEMMNIHEA